MVTFADCCKYMALRRDVVDGETLLETPLVRRNVTSFVALYIDCRTPAGGGGDGVLLPFLTLPVTIWTCLMVAIDAWGGGEDLKGLA